MAMLFFSRAALGGAVVGLGHRGHGFRILGKLMTCTQQKQTLRSATSGVERQAQLPPLWQESILQNAREEAERINQRSRRKKLSFSIAATLVAGVVARPTTVHAATDHEDPITGVADNDRPGGTGGYDPGYDIVDQNGTLHYRFADGDSVALEGVDGDLRAMSITSGNPAVVLDVAGGGWLELSAIRGENSTVGSAVGILNDGNTVTVNGNTRISTNADDLDFGMVRGNGAQGVIGRGRSTTIFNGATDIHARTQGYARGVWADRTSTIIFNGPTTILAESRGTLDAVYSLDGRITFNGDTTISALSIWPSDNAHAIYNDGVGSRLTVNGDLSLTTVAMGSTAFGVRNQGNMEVTGDTTVNVQGPRSTHGIANTHWRARMTWNGDVDVRVRSEGPENGYTPFGKPSGLSNDRSPGAVMTFNGAVNVDVASETETYGLVSTGTISFTSPTAPVSFTVASSCDGCAVYGIRNFGTVDVAGGLTVSTSATGAGAAYSIWSVPLDTQNASVAVNQAGGHTVQLDGDIVTASDATNRFVGSVDLNLDTPDSWLRGSVGGLQTATGLSVGKADLTFANGARWIPQGNGALSNDLGSGSLTLGNAGAVDMAAFWGTFSPAAVPVHSYRRLAVDSSNTSTGASVALTDGARFLVLSDITGINGTASADQIVFGSGIRNFSATGTQRVGIVYDPVLDDTAWVNATTVRDGRSIQADSAIGIVDASAAAGGSAAFSAVAGLDGEWSGTYENALVKFTYTPQVTLSADGKRIMLTGITIHGAGGNDDDDDDDDGEDIGILPSETVKTAADAADSLVNLWKISGQTSLQRVRSQTRDNAVDQSSVWVRSDNGQLTAKTAYSRSYRQDYTGVTLGADHGFALANSSAAVGFTAGHLRSTARYTLGRGELSGTTLGLYGRWSADRGSYVLLGVGASSLENRYSARDSQGREIAGRYRAETGQFYAEGGYPFQLSKSYYLEPQLGLSVGAIRDSQHTTVNGVRIDQDRFDSSFARVGVAFGRKLQGARRQGNVYARASAMHYFGDHLDITASMEGGSIVPETAKRKGTGGELVLGADVTFSRKRTGLFFEASGASGMETKRYWAVQAGLRHSW
jgi:outer membrane autotransporter protein